MILSHSGWNKENIYIDIYIKIYLYPVLCLWAASPLHTDTLDTQNLRLQTCHLWRPMSSKWRLRHMGSQASSAASGATLRSACLHGAFLKSAFWGSQITPFWTRKPLYIVWHTFCISLLKQLFWIHIASTHGGCHEARYHEKGVFPSAAGNESTSGPWVDLTFMYVHCMYFAASGNYIYILYSVNGKVVFWGLDLCNLASLMEWSAHRASPLPRMKLWSVRFSTCSLAWRAFSIPLWITKDCKRCYRSMSFHRF